MDPGSDEGDDDELFREAMADVAPLENRDRRGPPKARAEAPKRTAPGPRRFEIEAGTGRAHGVTREVIARLRRGEPPPDERLDLHRMRADAARIAVASRIRGASAAGHRCVLVIVGRGRHSGTGPVLRDVVIETLTRSPTAGFVLAFCPARGRDGGDGAIYVLLKSQLK